jgi:hypothetical protein
MGLFAEEMPHFFAPDNKNYFQDFENQRYIGIFMSQRVREREREREIKTKRESESKSGKGKEKGTGKGTGKGKGREHKSADDFFSKLPGPK